MKLPVEWLRELISTDLSDEALASAMTMAGLEVEEILDSEDGPVFHTKVTPNRGDWMSVVGHAREAAAALDIPLGWTAPVLPKEAADIDRWAAVAIGDPSLCPRYAGKVIRNVTIGQSPDWMQKRLAAAGMRPINVVVDVTNYVMLELGQPLHAFDYDTIPEGRIVVRATREGESITTLDGSDRPLSPGTLAICDSEHPIAVAGVMGGVETEVTAGTRNIFLESAHFDPGAIRRASKDLSLSTEASYRFERHVDPELVPIALERAAELLADCAGGEVVLGRIDVYPKPAASTTITLRPARCNAILGTVYNTATMAHALRRLGMTVHSGETLIAEVPTYRPDLTAEIDLIEEVGRMTGYETLPETLPNTPGAVATDGAQSRMAVRLRGLLSGFGLREASTLTLTPPSAFEDPAHFGERVTVRSALSAELSGLRRSLVPNLLGVLAHNIRQRQLDVRLFEVGKVFSLGAKPGEYREGRHVAAVLTGQSVPKSWASEPGRVDFYAAKGLVEALATGLKLNNLHFRAGTRPGMHPGRTADILIGSAIVGYVAEVDPDVVREDLDVPAGVGRISVFELDADILMTHASSGDRYRPAPRFPAITRDISIEVPRTVPFAQVDAIGRESTDPELLEELSVVSVYTGERVSGDKKAVAFRMTFRAQDRTLTDIDVDSQVAEVAAALTSRLGAVRR